MRTYRHASRGLARGLRLGCALALLAPIASHLHAQQRRNLAEVSAAALFQSFDGVTDLGSAFGGVGRIGFWLPYHFSVEGEGVIAPAKTKTADVGVSVRSFAASLLYNIPVGRESWMHLRVGGGSTRYGDPCENIARPIICGSSGALIAGAGVRLGVAPTVLVRSDLVISRNRSQRTDRTVNLTNVGISAGISYMLGSKPIPDSDGDGILDNRDRCPDTPAGAQVDGTGCPRDTDGDGVPDGVDRCANTAPGAAVNASGCSQDSDGDNIADGLDKCPETEPGVLVDPNGCPKDSDGDSIPDGLDRCSETPRGATVDALGCPGDEDGDGILDGLDRCPRTPSGVAIDATGCPSGGQGAERAEPTPREETPPQRTPPQETPPQNTPPQAAPPQPSQGAPRQPSRAAPRPRAGEQRAAPRTARPRITAGVLPRVGFAPGTARLLPESYIALDSLVEILQPDTTLRVEVGAHTDNTGTPSQDMHLTNLQAEAVRTYLVTKGVSFQQVVPRGYGSSVPLTPDNTPRGRLANRRVEVKPVAPGL